MRNLHCIFLVILVSCGFTGVNTLPRMRPLPPPQELVLGGYDDPSSIIPVFDPERPSVYRYGVLHQYPHDPEAFTQGLSALDGSLYEGTGQRRLTDVRQVDLVTGAAYRQTPLVHAKVQELFGSLSVPAGGEYFGEGITLVGNDLVQLTWTSGMGFVYDRKTMTLRKTFSYESEGWGLTYDGNHLIHSDGTPTLQFRNADVDSTDFFRVQKEVRVTCRGALAQSLVGWRNGKHRLCSDGELSFLNELEFVEGYVYANVWQTNYIAVIDPVSGALGAWIDLSGLENPAGHLNGIAYDQGKLFVTGKNWPVLYEIEVIL